MSELDILLNYLFKVNLILIFLDYHLLITIFLIFMDDFAFNNFPLQIVRIGFIIIIIVNKVIFDLISNWFRRENFRAVVLNCVDPQVIVDVLLLCELELDIGLLLVIEVIKII